MTEEAEKAKRMEETIPADDQSIYSAFDDQSSTLPAVFGGLIGLQNKDIYAIIERTNLPNEEIRIIVDKQNTWTHRTLETQALRIVPIRHRAGHRCGPHHVGSPRK